MMLESLSNNPGLIVLLLLAGTALVGGATLWRVRGEWALFQQWRAAGMPGPQLAANVFANTSPSTPLQHHQVAPLDATPLPGAGRALKNPPADLRAIVDYIRIERPGDAYTIPLGWQRLTTGGPDLVTAQLVGEVNSILITGQSNAGKDNAVMGMCLALASQHSPQQVQFCFVDGKGLDWGGWENKAHTWRLAIEPEEIAPAMLAISSERARRGKILRAAGVSKWDEYQGGDLPLLVVFISELSLLEDATKPSELTAWLNSELAAGRAYGLRFIVGTQNASNFSTRWRGQIGLFLAGFQASRAADEPNTMLPTAELEAIGAIPPSQLPAPSSGAQGVFTAVQDRSAYTVRASLLTDQHRAWALAQLPNKAPQIDQPQLDQAARPAAPARPAAAARPDDTALLALLHSGQPLPLADELVGQSYRATESPERTFVGQSAARSTSVDSRSTGGPATSYEVLPLADDVVPFDEQKRILETAKSVRTRRQLTMQLYNTDGGQKSTWVRLVCDALGLLPSAKGGA